MPATRRRTRELSKESGTAGASKSRRPNRTTKELRGQTTFRVPLKTTKDALSTDSTDLKEPTGLPSRQEFDQAQEEYIQSLSPRKQEKALITQEMFDDIWDVLHQRMLSKVRTPQFRFWVRKMFTLSVRSPSMLPAGADHTGGEANLQPVILHEGRPIAVKSQIYDIIGHCHQLCQHGGRDRTTAHVKTLYSWVPKELVSKFVKLCPTCTSKRSGASSRATVPKSCTASAATPTQEEISASRILPPPTPCIGSTPTFSDPHLWLSNLVSDPGPQVIPSVDLQLPPLLRRTESENDAVPLHKPTTRINLPPLMKALSENILDFSAPVQRIPFNVPESLQIPLRPQPTDTIDIDPSLLDSSPPCSTACHNDPDRSRDSIVATLIELPRKVLIAHNAPGALDDIQNVQFSAASQLDLLQPASSDKPLPASSVSFSASSFSGSVHDIIASLSGQGNLSDISMSHSGNTSYDGRKSDRSVGSLASEQDWELSYCLDSSF